LNRWTATGPRLCRRPGAAGCAGAGAWRFQRPWPTRAAAAGAGAHSRGPAHG